MTIGIFKNKLTVLFVTSKMATLLTLAYVLSMGFTEKIMKEFMHVTQRGFKTEVQLQEWIELWGRACKK